MKHKTLGLLKKSIALVLVLGTTAHIHAASEGNSYNEKAFNFTKARSIIMQLKAQSDVVKNRFLERAVEEQNISKACIGFLALDLDGQAIAELCPSLWLLKTVAKHIPAQCRAARQKIVTLYRTALEDIEIQLRQLEGRQKIKKEERECLELQQKLYSVKIKKCQALLESLHKKPDRQENKKANIAIMKTIKARQKDYKEIDERICMAKLEMNKLRNSQDRYQASLKKIKSLQDEIFKKTPAIVRGLSSFKYEDLRYRDLNSDVYHSGCIPLAICLDESKNIVEKRDADGIVQEYRIEASLLQVAVSQMINTKAIVITTRVLGDLLLHVLSAPEAKLTRDIRLLKHHINAQSWSCFYCGQADFVIWIPKVHQNKYENLFKPWLLDEVDLENYEKMVEYTKKPYHIKTESRPADLIELFNDQVCRQALNIVLTGHGNSKEKMAGMWIDTSKPESQRITSFLSFLSKKMNVDTLLIFSCKAGGNNKQLLQCNADLMKHVLYNYRLILASNTDKSIHVEPVHVVPHFFKNAALRLPSEKMAYDLHYQKQGGHDVHGCSAFPLVLEAGSNRFEYLRSPQGEETLLARPITTSVLWNGINDKQLLFSNDGFENIPLDIKPYRVESLTTLKAKISKSFLRHMPIYWTSNLQIEHRELYPEIRSLNSSDLYLHRVNLTPPANCPQSGILQFLRDAFCDISESSPEPRTIIIRKLSGINDISVQMRRARRAAGSLRQRACEKLFTHAEGEQITLRNSKVQIKEDSVALTITHPQTEQSFKYVIKLKKQNPIAWDFASI